MKNSMVFLKEQENGNESFKLIPINKDCSYIEIRFNYVKKILTIISKDKFEGFQIIPRINADGVYEKSKSHESGYKHERVRMAQFYDYSISDKENIKKFVVLMDGAVNPTDLEVFFIPVPEQKQTVKGDVPDGVKLTVEKKNGE